MAAAGLARMAAAEAPHLALMARPRRALLEAPLPRLTGDPHSRMVHSLMTRAHSSLQEPLAHPRVAEAWSLRLRALEAYPQADPQRSEAHRLHFP